MAFSKDFAWGAATSSYQLVLFMWTTRPRNGLLRTPVTGTRNGLRNIHNG